MVFREHRQFLLCCRLQPGSRLLTGCTDGVVKVWQKLHNIFNAVWFRFNLTLLLRFGTCADRPAWALSKQDSLRYPSIFTPLHQCLQVQPTILKITPLCIASFSAWTAGQQISVHSLGEGPRGAGLENRSVSDVILWRDFYGIWVGSESDLTVNMSLCPNSNVFYDLYVNVFSRQDIESDSLSWRFAWPETRWDDHNYLLGMTKQSNEMIFTMIVQMEWTSSFAFVSIHNFSLTNATGPVNCLKFHPNLLQLAAASTDSYVSLYGYRKYWAFGFSDYCEMWRYLGHFPVARYWLWKYLSWGIVKISLMGYCANTSLGVLWLRRY